MNRRDCVVKTMLESQGYPSEYYDEFIDDENDCVDDEIDVSSVNLFDKKEVVVREPSTFIDSKGVKIDTKRKFRRFVFTWNNYPLDYESKLYSLGANYLVAGTEVAPSTGTKHIQGYCEMKKQYRIGEFAKLVWETTCINGNRSTGISKFEPAIASADDNYKYCTKECENPYEYGEKSTAGKRNDIKMVRDLLKQGKGMKTIVESVDSYQAMRSGELMLKYIEKKREHTDDFKVVWIYGLSGTGKTYMTRKEHPEAYVHTGDSKWWDGYDGEDEVIIDDMRSNFCKFSTFLKMLQPQPYRVEYKGGSRELLATKFYITSCYSPIEMYEGISENRSQFYRRIDQIEYYDETDVIKTITFKKTELLGERVKRLKTFCKKYCVDHSSGCSEESGEE